MVLASPEGTHELVARIQAGDVAAWDALWSRLHDDLLFVVRCRLGSGLRLRLESEDILQSVVKDALGEIASFEPRGEGALRHLLGLMVTRKIRKRAATFAAAKRRGTAPLETDVPDPRSAPRYRDPDRYEALERAMDALEPDEREIVLLHRVEGAATKEIAARLKSTDVAVRKRYSRALAKLRRHLGATGRAP